MNELPQVKTVTTLDDRQVDTVFLPAFIEDNQIGLERDPEYVTNNLDMQDDRTRKALKDGDWSVFSGQFLPEFSRLRHVIDPFEIPRGWTRFRGYDWGFAAQACMLWFAKDPANGRIYCYNQLYQAGLTDPHQAEKINDMTQPWERFTYSWGDPSLWTRRTTEYEAKSTYDVFLEHGILMSKADNDQVRKAKRVRMALGDIHDGKPGLMIFSTCNDLIVELKALMSDPKRIEIPMAGQQEHAYDALAYGLTGYEPPIVRGAGQQKQQEYQNEWAGVKGL